jgi:hypothetical protein
MSVHRSMTKGWFVLPGEEMAAGDDEQGWARDRRADLE